MKRVGLALGAARRPALTVAGFATTPPSNDVAASQTCGGLTHFMDRGVIRHGGRPRENVYRRGSAPRGVRVRVWLAAWCARAGMKEACWEGSVARASRKLPKMKKRAASPGLVKLMKSSNLEILSCLKSRQRSCRSRHYPRIRCTTRSGFELRLHIDASKSGQIY